MSESANGFDPKDFRRALSQFPTGVTVITAVDSEGNPVGVTASSFNSVSIEPALVLWSIDKGANSLATFENAEYFAVNVLSRDQVNTSNNFASRGTDKFAAIDYSKGLGDAPLLADYAAQFECKTWAVYEGGDHLIIVGQVEKYRFEDSAEPLVFARGSYAVSNQHPAMKKSVAAENSAQGGDFVTDYLLYLLRVSYQGFSEQLYPKLKQVCDVTPEEWRVLARLISTDAVNFNELAELALQPEIGLKITLDSLTLKGLVVFNGEQVSISAKGSEVAGKMKEIAISEEAELLTCLNDNQRATLKDSLKAIFNALD